MVCLVQRQTANCEKGIEKLRYWLDLNHIAEWTFLYVTDCSFSTTFYSVGWSRLAIFSVKKSFSFIDILNTRLLSCKTNLNIRTCVVDVCHSRNAFWEKKLEWEEQRYWWAFTSSKKDRHRGREVVFPLCNIFWR